jgi:toxin-antitoxin system PIN domain toxin
LIVPDVNLLVYAHDELAPLHGAARSWWEGLLSGRQAVLLPWAVVFGFVRLVTHASVLREPLGPPAAVQRVRGWLERPQTELVEPGPRHLEIVERLFAATGVGGNLTTDTHLAAIAIEHRCELHSNDADFGRFPGLRWRNPLVERGRQ